MQIKTRKAGEIIADMMDQGPLYKFIIASKKRATSAVTDFAYQDLTDTTKLMELQVQIRSYEDLLFWIESTLEDSRQAEASINEEFGEYEDEEYDE